MSIDKQNASPLRRAYRLALQSFKDKPSIFIPFVIFAALEVAVLTLLYFFPRMPFRLIFGPPIRVLWGEQFLHYPLNFMLLPKLVSLSKMFLSVFFGSLLTGAAIAMAGALYARKTLSLKGSLAHALKKYIHLFIIVFILTASFYISTKIVTIGIAKYFIAGHKRLLFLQPRLWMGPLLTAINFGLAIFIQALFVYAVPLLMLGEEKLFKAIFKSAALFKKHFFPTLLIAGLPMLFYIPVILLNYNTAGLINKLFPESIVFVLLFSIAVGSLLIDPIVTISASFFYLLNRDQNRP